MFDKTTILRIGFLIVGLALASVPKCHDQRCSYNRVIGHAAHMDDQCVTESVRQGPSRSTGWPCPLCAAAKASAQPVN